ncbi:MAG: response regulator transcription factor [Burkholderiales bacterium]|nr:response regulator transcription factor [Burkholderiales bacterium]
MRLLLVEDDEMIGKSIREGLRREGYGIDWVRDGWAAEQSLTATDYDLLILDLGLPRVHGLQVLKNTRQKGKKIPVLVITARDGVEDRVNGLDAGADDYLVKPFSMSELGARVRALLRRSAGQADPVFRHGGIELNPLTREVLFNKKSVALSQREFALLESLIRHPGTVISRTSLEQSIYAWGQEVESNAVEVHISNLRKKLSPKLIKTVRGVGYKIAGQ